MSTTCGGAGEPSAAAAPRRAACRRLDPPPRLPLPSPTPPSTPLPLHPHPPLQPRLATHPLPRLLLPHHSHFIHIPRSSLATPPTPFPHSSAQGTPANRSIIALPHLATTCILGAKAAPGLPRPPPPRTFPSAWVHPPCQNAFSP
eukprot:238921-Chlamydomonas_euryale.AAC.2